MYSTTYVHEGGMSWVEQGDLLWSACCAAPLCMSAQFFSNMFNLITFRIYYSLDQISCVFHFHHSMEECSVLVSRVQPSNLGILFFEQRLLRSSQGQKFMQRQLLSLNTILLTRISWNSPSILLHVQSGINKLFSKLPNCPPEISLKHLELLFALNNGLPKTWLLQPFWTIDWKSL